METQPVAWYSGYRERKFKFGGIHAEAALGPRDEQQQRSPD